MKHLLSVDDLVRDARERPPEVGGVEHPGPEREYATRSGGRVVVVPGSGVSRHAFLP